MHSVPQTALRCQRTVGTAILRILCRSSRNSRSVQPRRSFNTFIPLQRRQDLEVSQPKNTVEQPKKPTRVSAGKKTSLRQVAVEAATLIRTRGKTRFVDPNAQRKTITAYCAAEMYDISRVAQLMSQDGYVLDPFQIGLDAQIVHVQTPIFPSNMLRETEENLESHGDIFVFPSGTVVAWNVPERVSYRIVSHVLKPAAESPHIDTMETEHLEYINDASAERSVIYGDTIVLATDASSQPTGNTELGLHITPATAPNPESAQTLFKDVTLAKIAFSSGLAASTKLAVLESLLEEYVESTRGIPKALAQPHGRRFTRSFILRKTGELLNIRAQLNLYSELTDSLPDLFWDSKHELGLEGYYVEVGKALDVPSRIDALNNKMDYASEIATVLRERLSERHGLALEWGIIALIAVEVVIEVWRTWREWEPPAEKSIEE